MPLPFAQEADAEMVTSARQEGEGETPLDRGGQGVNRMPDSIRVELRLHRNLSPFFQVDAKLESRGSFLIGIGLHKVSELHHALHDSLWG